MIFRFFLIFWVFLFFGCKTDTFNQQIEPKVATSKKPNIVFILADDLGLYDLSVTGSRYYETPNIDFIASGGTIFTQGYASSRVCSPSRASIMTGQFTARHGITDWIGAASGKEWREQGHNDRVMPSDYRHELPKSSTTLAEAMQGAGYKTFFAGKWHLGNESSIPEKKGFDINKGGWDVGSPIGGYFSPWENPKLKNNEPGENLSERLGKETASFIEANKNQPFFAMLSFYAVHGPIQTTKERWKKYRDKAQNFGISNKGFEMERILPIRTVQDNPIYAGLVEQMDEAVGIVLSKLKELGLEKNTIVIFTSDNGGVASGDAFSTTNLPLRGGKGYQWEGGIREPYFIKVPFYKNAPKEIDFPVSGTDFYPTILDLVGIEIPTGQTIDGVSLKPLLQNGSLSQRSLFWHYPHYGNQGGEPSSIIRKGSYKLIHYWEDNRNELYDLPNDPNEQHDLAASNKQTTDLLFAELNYFLTDVGAQIPEKDALFDIEAYDRLYQKNRTILMKNLENQRQRFLSKDFKPNEDWWGSKITQD